MVYADFRAQRVDAVRRFLTGDASAASCSLLFPPQAVTVKDKSMRNTALELIAVTVAMVAITPIGRAQRRGATDSLAANADAVVVGEIQSGRQTGTAMAFILAVSRSLKGPFDPGGVVSVRASAPDSVNGSLGGQYGLWFLKQSGGQWSALPAEPSNVHASPYLPMPKTSSPSSITTKSPPSTVYDRLAIELAAAVQSSSTSSRSFFQLADALLDCGESGLIPELHHALRAHADPVVRSVGSAGLVRTPEGASALSEIADNIGRTENRSAKRFQSRSICGLHDPSGVRSLSRIAEETGEYCAVEALANIHTVDTLPALANLLGHTDPKIRELAMRGLSRFVNNFPITHTTHPGDISWRLPQGPTPYRTPLTDEYSLATGALSAKTKHTEAEYLQFWKSWWANMKTELTRGH